MLIIITFYLVSSVTIFAATMVVFSRNTIHSVLWLICVFLNVAILFVTLGAEFLAMILVIVYVGAVAVLFMFVVMMLNISKTKIKSGFSEYFPIGSVLTAVLLAEFVLVSFSFSSHLFEPPTGVISDPRGSLTNTEELGKVLYTKYFYLFQLSGLILLVAMVAAIVLTLRTGKDVQRQEIGEQVERGKQDAIEIRKIKPYSGAK
ncbi:MAG: NADH:ubiquinone oxidoreductase subunit J [Rhodospirillaceae bacterium]|nr:NADH:ubiquinone oxidoreductase subunit J [Rhodospirillaceae bacterium]|tara:strand:+ start:1162 stop:1773 length:612 start_codon:yes stop_codon:yes gene_type:complete